MKKFRTESYSPTQITEVECVKETEKSVVVVVNQWRLGGPPVRVEVRHPKVGTSIYHDTWEAARAHLLERAERKLTQARRDLDDAQGEYGNVKGMKKPADSLQSKD